jgi:cobyrinic acid a,c-diamide synthase
VIAGVVLAGTHSGCGKTTVSTGIMAALSKRCRVQAFKVGPDFIDPTHHTEITGRASRNLDLYMMGEGGVVSSFNRAASGADIAVVEGVMGLFDGLEGGFASTAHVAKTLGLPVILVVDVKGMGQSAAALIKGYASFDSDLRVSGVILNRVGSDRHREMIESAVRECELDIPIIGSIPKRQEVHTPSRHLGLHMGWEAGMRAGELADLICEHVDLDQMVEIAKTASVPQATGEACERGEGDVKIGVALDESFCFYYQDTFEHLQRLAQVEFFSPMRDPLPQVDGLYLGGGYPELHAKALSESSCRELIKKAAGDGMPIYGECGALLYLCKTLRVEDETYPMCGVFDAHCEMTPRLQALGYTKAVTLRDNVLTERGTTVLGHEFHYSKTTCEHDQRFAYRMERGKGVSEGFDGLMYENTLSSYNHGHPASMPFTRFVEQCRRYRRT